MIGRGAMDQNNIKIYQTADGETRIDVRFERDTLWLTQAQMAELFDKDSDTIGLHLKNIYESGELEENSTTEDSSVVRQEGKRQVKPVGWGEERTPTRWWHGRQCWGSQAHPNLRFNRLQGSVNVCVTGGRMWRAERISSR
jgi:hypothetical protein